LARVASGFLWIYLGRLLLMVVGFMAVGAGVGGAIGGVESWSV
jgi:hypothetical protein